MGKRTHKEPSEFHLAQENEQALPLGELLGDLEDEFDHEDEEEL